MVEEDEQLEAVDAMGCLWVDDLGVHDKAGDPCDQQLTTQETLAVHDGGAGVVRRN